MTKLPSSSFPASRKTTAMLLGSLPLLATCSLVDAAFIRSGLAPRVPGIGDLIFMYSLLPPALWIWWAHRVSTITVSPDGVRQKTPLRSRFIPWEELQYSDPPGAGLPMFLHLRGARTHIRVFTLIDNVQALRALLGEKLVAQKPSVPAA